MKHIITTTVFSLLCLCMAGQSHLVERAYVVTDKDCYVAGDNLWMSVFCMDVNAGSLSSYSSIAYVELVSAEGPVQTAKVALRSGRGAGRMVLSNNIPTGNYNLVVYTAQNKNEEGYDYLKNAKTISVFNTLAGDRAKDGVKIVEKYQEVKTTSIPGCGEVELEVTEDSVSGGAGISIKNLSSSAMSLSLSVYHDDGIVSSNDVSISDFVSSMKDVGNPRFGNGYTIDYEGEIIHARIAGGDPSRVGEIVGNYAFVSVPGEDSDIYINEIEADGTIDFYTGNIYGDRELVCEIEGLKDDQLYHLEIIPPFVGVKSASLPVLELSESLSDRLLDRSVSMQVGRRFDADTLYDFLPVRKSVLFHNSDKISYKLDDYTRFPLMEEVFVEFIPEIRARNNNGDVDIQIRIDNIAGQMYFSRLSSLMLIDGTPIFDQSKILGYDPLLVSSIDIYPYTYYLGKRVFTGIVDFKTYKKNLPEFQFEDNVRIVDFQGASYPMAFTGEHMDSDYPDIRQTLCWLPVCDVEAGETFRAVCKMPDYKGTFKVVVEGMDTDGNPVYTTSQIVFD